MRWCMTVTHWKWFFVFVHLSLFALITSAAGSERYARVIAYQVVVYDHYSLEGMAIAIHTEGAELRVLGREDDPDNGGIWVYVVPREGGRAGWVPAASLDFGEGVDPLVLPVVDGSSTQTPFLYRIEAVTRAAVHLWTNPGAEKVLLREIAMNVPLTVVGRNESAEWFEVEVEGVVGWVTRTFIEPASDLTVLPVTYVLSPEDAQHMAQVMASLPMLPAQHAGVVSNIGPTALDIYRRGQELGNDSHVFAKVGDSITASTLFLTQIGQGMMRLEAYEYLRPVVEHFLIGRIQGSTPFEYPSLAARTGWRSDDLLNPARNPSALCAADEFPLMCEYRISRPSIALIMIGTNDLAQVSSSDYRRNLETIVEISIARGVVPVLSTLPDRLNSPTSGRVREFNAIIRDVALTYQVPLWDYWLAMGSLPNWGISIDGIHPSHPEDLATAIFTPQDLDYGYTVRNLTALMLLDAVWRGVMSQP